MDNPKKPAYGRQIITEIAGAARPWRWQWRGRYVPGAQLAQVLVLAATAVLVWALADTPGRGGWAALVAYVGGMLAAGVAEAEARVTERGLATRRWTQRPALSIPDGYVLAFEVGNQARQLGADLADPYLSIGAIRADRWDMTEPLWRFTVRQSAITGGGVLVQVPAGNFAAVEQLHGFWPVLDTGTVLTLVAVERHLIQLGARDVTSAYHLPAGPQ